MSAALRTVALCHRYRLGDGEEVVALDEVELEVPAGTSAAVVGPSGSGKSTLLTILAGLQRPTSGQAFIGDLELTALDEVALLAVRGQQLAVVAQNPYRNLLPYATGIENLRFAARGARARGRTGIPDPRELLDRLGLGAVADSRTDRMSGGERQRLALGAGLASNPEVLLADEPTSQLDEANRDVIASLLARIRHDFGVTVLVVTHDPAVAAGLDRRFAMNAGRLMEVRS